MESDAVSVRTAELDNSNCENSNIVPTAESCKTNVDERKRKQDDPGAGVSKKVKITNPSSLGLSLLQSYDEDMPDDVAEADDVVADNENLSVINAEGVLGESDDKVTENVSADNLINDNLCRPSDACAVESAIIDSKESVHATPNVGKTPTLSANMQLDETEEQQITKNHVQNPSTTDSPNVICGKENVSEPVTNVDKSSSGKSYVAEETSNCSTTNDETAISVHSPTFATADEIGIKNGSTEEKASNKPAKKVKLNRSKFFRPADESSNECKLSPTTDLSGKFKSSSTTDRSFKSVVEDKSQNYSDSISLDSAASNEVTVVSENICSDSRAVSGKKKDNNEFSSSADARGSPAHFRLTDETMNITIAHTDGDDTFSSQPANDQSNCSIEMSSEIIDSTVETSVFENHSETKASADANVSVEFTNDSLLDRDSPSKVASEPVSSSTVLPADEKYTVSLNETTRGKSDNETNEHSKLVDHIENEAEGEGVGSEFSSPVGDSASDNAVIEDPKTSEQVIENEETDCSSSVAVAARDSERVEDRKTGEEVVQAANAAIAIDSGDDLANDDERLTFEDTVEGRDNASSDEEIFRDAMETVESESEEKVTDDCIVQQAGKGAEQYDVNEGFENTVPTSTNATVESETNELVVLPDQTVDKFDELLKQEPISETIEEPSMMAQTSGEAEELPIVEQPLENVDEPSSKVVPTSEAIEEPAKLAPTPEHESSKPEQTSNAVDEQSTLTQTTETVGAPSILERSLKTVEEPSTVTSPVEEAAMELAKPERTSEKIEEPSKLEQALTGKFESSRCNQAFKKQESTAGGAGRDKRTTDSTVADETARYVVNVTESTGVKENIKLHISLQGNRASIKKAKEPEPNVVAPPPPPAPVSTADVETITPVPEAPRVKRKYTKRKVVPPAGLNSDEKTYKLRTRNARKQSEKADAVPAVISAKKASSSSKDCASSAGESGVDGFATVPDVVDKASVPPLTVEIDRLTENVGPRSSGKVPTIKLKISKNSGMTATEITSKNARPTPDKAEARGVADGMAPPIDDQVAQLLDQARKKEAAASTLRSGGEQGACTWSGKDLQRVERLLKESNVTITPVSCSKNSSSILKPMLTETKQRSAAKVPAATVTPVTTSASSSITHSTAAPAYEDTVAIRTESGATLETKPIAEKKTRNLNVILKPLDLEDEIRHWKVAKSSDDRINIGDDGAAPCKSEAVVDVKTEIRRKIASAERRKQDMNGSDAFGLSDTKAASTISSSGGKSLPDLLPIGQPFGGENGGARAMPVDSNVIIPPSESPTTDAVDAKPVEFSPSSAMYAVLPPAMFPKKRGRPTKAMVAARNAYRRSQEALENLRRQQNLQGGQLPFDTSNMSPHFLIPSVDVSSSEQTDATSGSPQTPSKTKRGRKPKDRFEGGSSSDYSANDGSITQSAILDPEREVEEMKRLEEERIRKEHERERKNELRRQKARERSDLVKAKRLRQKMKAEERQRRMQEQKRLLQEEKKKLEEEIKKLPATVGGFDAARIRHEEYIQLQNNSFLGMDDDSNSTMDLSQRIRKSKMEVYDSDSNNLTVDQIAEYQWPIQGGELYMIQEQISNFLGVKSFKRKYPDIKRRPVDSEERAYLVDSGLVSETLCDLGITAVSCTEVLDIMCSDFPEKYEELRKYMREKQMKEMTFKQKAWANGLGYKLLMADGTKQDLKKRAMESASNWNSALNKSRGEDRRCAMDLQTFIIHYPKNKAQKMTVPTPKVGSFPVSILPGQFSDFYKEYTSTELRYMPLNTVLYGPLKHPEAASGADGSQTDSDDSSSSDESSSTTSESTQATEETIEDVERDVSMSVTLDDSTTSQLAAKLQDVADVSSKDEEEVARRELLNSMRETLTAAEDDNLKALCKICLGDHSRNKENVQEVLIRCSQCNSTSHPTCLDLSLSMVPHIRSYKWQCPDCKSCARCKENADEDKMLFCDNCDRGYHIYCVGLKKVPSGSWQCQECVTVDNGSIPSSVVMIPRVGIPRETLPVKEET